MVFQDYGLYPHMTVRENLSLGLRLRKIAAQEIDRRVTWAAGMLGLTPLLDRKPKQLSGGQRQRVAMGRAMVREPKVFLFDEPLSNLDAQLRVETRVELARLHRKLGATMVYVTHDQSEALTLGDRIAVLKEGVLQQIATPMELYNRPANKFVAGFIGSPAMNFIEGVIQRPEGAAGRRGMCKFKGIDLTLDVPCDDEARGRVFLGVRPQHITVSGDGENRPKAEVGVVEPMGNEQIVYVTLSGGDRLVAVAPPQELIKPGDIVSIQVRPEGVHIFDGETGRRMDPSPYAVES
jgi:multiple sugar transport system ATP-binding protein